MAVSEVLSFFLRCDLLNWVNQQKGGDEEKEKGLK